MFILKHTGIDIQCDTLSFLSNPYTVVNRTKHNLPYIYSLVLINVELTLEQLLVIRTKLYEMVHVILYFNYIIYGYNQFSVNFIEKLFMDKTNHDVFGSSSKFNTKQI